MGSHFGRYYAETEQKMILIGVVAVRIGTVGEGLP